jgi:hypothetical protein
VSRDEHNPISGPAELPAPEIGDHGSFEGEPDGGGDTWAPPEVERLDLTADEPPADADPLGESA